MRCLAIAVPVVLLSQPISVILVNYADIPLPPPKPLQGDEGASVANYCVFVRGPPSFLHSQKTERDVLGCLYQETLSGVTAKSKRSKQKSGRCCLFSSVPPSTSWCLSSLSDHFNSAVLAHTILSPIRYHGPCPQFTNSP